MNRFENAKQRYEQLGIDVEAALSTLMNTPVSINCWQGDDITGFENSGAEASGGIQVTGDYPGKARNFEELKADFTKACSLIPGKKRINLHASYAVFEDGEFVDRDRIEYKHFAKWVEFAKSQNLGIDFNPTCFSHPKIKDGLTLSSPDEETRRFWINHCKQSRKIAAEIARELGDTVSNNIWIPDGLKDVPGDRLGPRLRLKASLDEIFAEKYEGVIDCVESKVFGIGLESYTVGSSEFYLNYAASHPGVYNLMDSGHYHPTETISDKISAMLPFFDYIPLHLTRAVRWDSDHVVSFDDDTREICREMAASGDLSKFIIAVDFFDASINRIAAWVVGTRNVQKALLSGLLQPHARYAKLQDSGNFTEKMVIMEEMKTLPFGDIWEHYCEMQNICTDGSWLSEVVKYENDVLLKRS